MFFQEWEQLTVYHYGTEVAGAIHKGTYTAISSTLINELSKYSLDLETFMVESSINYKLFKGDLPKPEYKITWTSDHTGKIIKSGLTSYFSYNHRKDGNMIELIYKNQPTCSCWPDYLIDDELIPWFDAIWADIKTNNKQPRRFNLAQRIGSYLPLGFKAFSDGFNKAEVQRTRKKYAYMTQRGDRFYISKSPLVKEGDTCTESLSEAVSLVLKQIDSM